MNTDKPPKYLFKILSLENWEETHRIGRVKLSEDDRDFIHFSTEDQLQRIIDKYWNGIPYFIVLKIFSEKLSGNLIFEANPGGSNKYYHLYEGSIPMEAIAEVRKVSKK